MSDPVLDQDPTWTKSSRSDRIRIHIIGTINILYFIFQVCTHAQLSLSQFPLLPFFLLLPKLVTVFCHQKIDGASQPCTKHTARFTVSYFTVMFSNVFFLSMMRLFLSLLQGALIFLFPEKRGIDRNLPILS